MMPAPAMPGLSVDDHSRLLNFVAQINADQLDWQAAQAALHRLRSAMPQVALEIVSETENIGGDVTYCLLVTCATLVYSLSCARRDVLPWALRGATNAEANDLVTVNGHKVTVENAVHLLDPIWEQADLATRIIDMALLANEIAGAPVDLPDDAMTSAIERFYRERGLDTSEARRQWLALKGLSETRLRVLLHEAIVRRRVERALVAGELDAELREHARDYRGVRVMQCVIPDDRLDQAEQLLADAVPGANIATIVGAMLRSGSGGPPFRIESGELLRHELAPRADDVLDHSVGDLLLVRMASGATQLIELVAIEAETPDATIAQRIVRRLMQKWYSDKRSTARIEWHWGRSE